MNTSFQNILKLLVLGILILIFIAYLYLNRVVKEGFQTNSTTDINSNYFDLSANYNGLLKTELPLPSTIDFKEPPPILNIGSSLGTSDPANMPWDSENKELKQSEALWGIPPQQATMALYRKIYVAEQAQDISALPFNQEAQKLQFNDPNFNYGTDNPAEGNAFTAADALLPMAVQLGGMHFFPPGPLEAAHSITQAKEELLNLSKNSLQATKDLETLRANAVGKVGPELVQATKDIKVAEKTINSLAKNTEKVEKTLVKSTERLASFGKNVEDIYMKEAKNIANTDLLVALKLRNTPSSIALLKMLENLSAKIETKMASIKALLKQLKGIKGAVFLKGISALKEMGPVGKALSALGKGISKIASGLSKFAKAGAAAFAKIFQKIVSETGQRVIGTFAASLTSFQGLVVLGTFLISIGDMVNGPNLVIAGTILDVLYMAIVMPLMLILTLPDGPITKAMEKLSDPAGCCPKGSVPMDEVIPEALNLFLGLIPIVGDILGVLYPYICVAPLGEVGPPQLRFTLILPKYIQDEPSLTTQWLDWPEYDCSAGPAKVVGKKIIEESVPSRGLDGYITSPIPYSWGQAGYPYTNLADIISHPDNYSQITKVLNGFNATYTTTAIGKPGMPLYFSDFSEPTALVEMAQYYYNNAILNQTSNSDATVSVSYISKINYVIASSLFTCDVMCELTTATFDPVNGLLYNEVTTYDHDRRFYYASPNVGENPSVDYWGKSSDAGWTSRDDAVDSTLYILNDYIHNENYFNNEFLEGKVLITTYQQICEARDRYNYAQRTQSSDISRFKYNYDFANSNYSDFLTTIIKTNQNFTILSNNATNLILNNLTAQSNLFNYHVSSRPYNPEYPLIYNNPKYVLRGCTFS